MANLISKEPLAPILTDHVILPERVVNDMIKTINDLVEEVNVHTAELKQLAESVNQNTADLSSLAKIVEGIYNES